GLIPPARRVSALGSPATQKTGAGPSHEARHGKENARINVREIPYPTVSLAACHQKRKCRHDASSLLPAWPGVFPSGYADTKGQRSSELSNADCPGQGAVMTWDDSLALLPCPERLSPGKPSVLSTFRHNKP
ncbi:hypothetical protein Bbelb_444560, partial [Branchiostoma belcheri]